MNLRHLYRWGVFTLTCSILALSCKKDDDEGPVIEEPMDAITIDDVSVEIDENPELGTWLISVGAQTTVEAEITYRIVSQSVEGATVIDGLTGVLRVFTPAAFDFELNPEIIVEVEARVFDLRDTAQVTIRLNDLTEFTDAFVTTWRTTVANEGISIPVRSSNLDYNFMIDWGDGSEIEEGLTGHASHVYQNPSVYTVKIMGQFPAMSMRGSRANEKLLTVEQWGNIEWETMESAFYGCTNLKVIAEDAPDLSRVTSMKEMFATASSLTGDFSHWVVSSVEDMSNLFRGCRNFESDLSQWDVSNVQSMSGMFLSAESFNGALTNWDVSQVSDMANMFGGATAFNQDLSNWDVSAVTNMFGMFGGAESFDSDISQWNVSLVTDMGSMFREARAFSSDVSQWNVGSVTNMGFMFAGAWSLNSNLGSWDIRNVKSMRIMLNLCGLSVDNYDATLDGWSKITNPPRDIELNAANLKYCETGENARNLLINSYNWTIKDDEKANDCQ